MPPEPPPLPIDATVSTASKVFTITFDRALTPGSFGGGPWSAIANLTTGPRIWLPMGPVTTIGSAATFVAFDSGPSLPGTNVDYSPPPFDLVGLTDVPVAPFSGFPLTILP